MSNQVIGSVLVAGGGIAAIQAALDLANSGYKVYMVEPTASIGGTMAQLDKTFPTNDCSMCIMSPKLVEVGRHLNIELLTLANIESIAGQKGDFTVTVQQKARYVDMEKCIACGLCAQKCPKKVDDVFNEKLVKRKAAYVPYPQAVPLKYALDPDNCIYLTKGKCGNCAKVCPAGAINYEDKDKTHTLNVGAVILAPGFKAFDPSGMLNYGYAQSPNVMTSLEFERILSASGPTEGHLVRASDHKTPQKIAWLQCVGSRDTNMCKNSYCSSVCCMYAIKQAIIAKEHSEEPLDCNIFYMDMRTHGKGFEECYNKAKDQHGIRFTRCKVHSIEPVGDSGDLQLSYVDDGGRRCAEIYDQVVLSVGLEIPESLKELAGNLELELTPGGFCQTETFNPVATSRDGIFVCGAFAGPKDIPQSVIEAGSAAAMAGGVLTEGRDTLTTTKEVPGQKDIRGESPRIGVFVCSCGINIGGVVDVPAVRDYSMTLPNVVYATDNLYSCSQDTQNIISQVIEEKGLNRIIVAACSPKTHEPLFQETLAAAGLNKYLLEFVNIRNHDSWVHMNNKEAATKKAKDLVRMAAAKAAQLTPLTEKTLGITQSALVIGGGISGMAAAKALSAQGYPTTLIERDPVLGGQANFLNQTAKGEDVQPKLKAMIESVQNDPRIDCRLNTELTQVDGFVGNFKSTLSANGSEEVIEYGVAIVATGAREFQPNEYLHGTDERVITGLELDRRLVAKDPALSQLSSAVFIQCVGSRDASHPYCSRICCTHSMVGALHLKEMNPEMSVYILYRDIRTYAEKEELYKQAREKGIIFIRYSLEDKPKVSNANGNLEVTVTDHILQRPITVNADRLILASAIEPFKDETLAQFFKVPINEEGFFAEAHVKLSPSSFATDGVFLCGLAHYPKPIDESIAQAQAAVSSAVTVLAQKNITTIGTVARVEPMICASCGVCVEICPYSAPSFKTEGPFAGRAEINAALCKGCGLCVASCRSGALQLQGFEDSQLLAMLTAA